MAFERRLRPAASGGYRRLPPVAVRVARAEAVTRPLAQHLVARQLAKPLR